MESTDTYGVIICPATCWACKFDHHNPEPHTWWDSEDYEWAEATNQPLPTGYCGCYCSRQAVKELSNDLDEEGQGTVCGAPSETS